eukprot:Gb_26901 [translate_table: standard]
MRKFQVGSVILFALLISILAHHSLASRLLSQEKNEVWIPRANASKDKKKGSHDAASVSACEWEAVKGPSASRQEDDCEGRQYEDSDYIYSHPKP